MPVKPPIVDYEGPAPLSTRGPLTPWWKKSGGQVAASVCGFGLLCIIVNIGMAFMGGPSGFVGDALVVVAVFAFIVGSIFSVAAIFEAEEIRSHVRLGCSMAIALLCGFVALWIVGLILLGR